MSEINKFSNGNILSMGNKKKILLLIIVQWCWKRDRVIGISIQGHHPRRNKNIS
jgi:hypothetical protein